MDININNNSSPQDKKQQAIQSWHKPALSLLTQMLETRKANLRNRGYEEKHAAVKVEEWKQAMYQNYHLSYTYIQEIQQSLFKAGYISYIGREYMTSIGEHS